MKYISTRGNHPPVDSAAAIKMGMVPRGGLFIPESLPELEFSELRNLRYQQLANKVLNLFLTDYSEEEIGRFVDSAYNTDKFDDPDIAPFHYIENHLAVMELWHGPTAAFKDLALQIMPRFLTSAAEKLNTGKEIVILVATSGDTGKAALEGFRDVKGTRIIVFYPRGGVSKVQELQMLSTEGENTYSVAVEGNFDDCQTMVKDIFGDKTFADKLSQAGFEFSSANSINWGRLVPQIIYYFYAYMDMLEKKKVFIGDPINIAVPTGNFGNILAAYYAYKMGLPINKFICASNKNKVLADFIETGTYDRKREFHRTVSPSMDILISSNLERFLFDVGGHKPDKIERWYKDLQRSGKFKVDELTHQRISHLFTGGYANEEETLAAIKEVYEKYNYLIDTHTAVAYHVYRHYRQSSGDNTPTVIDSTASPYKFNRAVYEALTGDNSIEDEFAVMDKLHELTGVPVHRAVDRIQDREVRHHRDITLSQGRETILNILGVK